MIGFLKRWFSRREDRPGNIAELMVGIRPVKTPFMEFVEDMPDNAEGLYLGPRERPPPGVRKPPFPGQDAPPVTPLYADQNATRAFFLGTPDDGLRQVIAVANYILWEREQQRAGKAEPPFHN